MAPIALRPIQIDLPPPSKADTVGRSPATGRRGDRGFTLFEALAATMILAIALVAILQLFSGGLRTDHAADQYTRAVLHARERMEILLMASEMADETLSGRWDNGLAWEARIILQEEEEEGPPPADGLHTFHIHLQVRWDDGARPRRVAFETLALARLREDAP